MRWGSPRRSSLTWGSLVRHPSVGGPGLVPGTPPVRPLEQKVTTLGVSRHPCSKQAPALLPTCSPAFTCCLVSEDFILSCPLSRASQRESQASILLGMFSCYQKHCSFYIFLMTVFPFVCFISVSPPCSVPTSILPGASGAQTRGFGVCLCMC